MRLSVTELCLIAIAVCLIVLIIWGADVLGGHEMSDQSKDRLAGAAIIALTVISLVAIVVGVWAATVIGREVEGIVAIVAGAVGGIVGIIVQNKVGGTP